MSGRGDVVEVDITRLGMAVFWAAALQSPFCVPRNSLCTVLDTSEGRRLV